MEKEPLEVRSVGLGMVGGFCGLWYGIVEVFGETRCFKSKCKRSVGGGGGDVSRRGNY